MRLSRNRPGFLRRFLPPTLAVLIVAGLGAGAMYLFRQQQAQLSASEIRAASAETQLAAAQASLTAVVQAQTSASATAFALENDPSISVRNALALVFAAYQDPTDEHLNALADSFDPQALSVERVEAEHLLSAGGHLGGSSSFQVDIVSASTVPPDGAQVQTHEVWTYDERDRSDRQLRCITEDSQQTYSLRRNGPSWMVTDIQIGASHRGSC